MLLDSKLLPKSPLAKHSQMLSMQPLFQELASFLWDLPIWRPLKNWFLIILSSLEYVSDHLEPRP